AKNAFRHPCGEPRGVTVAFGYPHIAMPPPCSALDNVLVGTSKNRSYSSDATKLSANDSASFPFRFMDVHARAARDPHREQFFEDLVIVGSDNIDQLITAGKLVAGSRADFAKTGIGVAVRAGLPKTD